MKINKYTIEHVLEDAYVIWNNEKHVKIFIGTKEACEETLKGMTNYEINVELENENILEK